MIIELCLLEVHISPDGHQQVVSQVVVTHVDKVAAEVLVLTLGDVGLSLGQVSFVRYRVVISGVEFLWPIEDQEV